MPRSWRTPPASAARSSPWARRSGATSASETREHRSESRGDDGAGRGACALWPAPAAERLLQVVDSGPADLSVLGRGDAGDADRADELAVDDDRDAALERARAGQPEDAEIVTALSERIVEGLRGPAERHGRVGFFFRDLDAAELGAVHPLEHDEIATRVQHDHHDVPAVLLCLGLGAGHDLLRLLERD